MVRGRTDRVAQQVGEGPGVGRIDRGRAGQLQQRRRHVHQRDDGIHVGVGHDPGSGDDQRNPVRLFEGAEVVGIEPVGADVAAVVAHEHHDRVVQHAKPLELIQERPHLRVELADEGVVHRPRLAPLALGDGAEHLALAPVDGGAFGEGVPQAGGQVDRVQVIPEVGVAVGDEGDVGLREADAAGPWPAACDRGLQELLRGAGRRRAGAPLGRHARSRVVQDRAIAVRTLVVADRIGPVEEVGGSGDPRSQRPLRGGVIAAPLLPAEAAEVVAALDVPLAEVGGAVAGIAQPLRPVRVPGAQHALIVVHRVLDLQHTVVVRQHPRHQAGAGGRAGELDGVCAAEPQATLGDPVDVGRPARRLGKRGLRLHAVRHHQEQVGSRHPNRPMTLVTAAATSCASRSLQSRDRVYSPTRARISSAAGQVPGA